MENKENKKGVFYDSTAKVFYMKLDNFAVSDCVELQKALLHYIGRLNKDYDDNNNRFFITNLIDHLLSVTEDCYNPKTNTLNLKFENFGIDDYLETMKAIIFYLGYLDNDSDVPTCRQYLCDFLECILPNERQLTEI